jgi:hypothetical protein
MPKDETGTLDAHKLRELAAWYREFVQSRAFGKLGCALLSSWSATLIFWKGSVNSRLLLAPASPHRQPRLSGQGWGVPYRRCVYGVRGAISISTCCRVGW